METDKKLAVFFDLLIVVVILVMAVTGEVAAEETNAGVHHRC
jgi:hypothetical protein